MFTIHVDYHTGDSFHSYDTDTTLSGEWSLEVAKENLKRIKEHYTAYQIRNNYFSIALQDKAKKLEGDISSKSWYTGNYWEYSVNLLENDGTKKEYHCNWIGYFERLIRAEIISITPEDSDMVFEPLIKVVE